MIAFGIVKDSIGMRCFYLSGLLSLPHYGRFEVYRKECLDPCIPSAGIEGGTHFRSIMSLTLSPVELNFWGLDRKGVLSQSVYTAVRSSDGLGSIRFSPSNRRSSSILKPKCITKCSATRLANPLTTFRAFSLTALV